MRQVRRWVANPRFDDLQEQLLSNSASSKADYEHIKAMLDALIDTIRDIRDEMNDLRLATEDMYDVCQKAMNLPKSEPKKRGRPAKK
jgi:hypothetical protein